MDISKLLSAFRFAPQSRQPMYRQIAGEIQKNIDGLIFPAGTKLPPERELAELCGVSRTTTINAYRYLEQQGLVITRLGSGTYVAESSAGCRDSGFTVPWMQLMTPFPRVPSLTVLRDILNVDISESNISLAAGMPDPALYPVDFLQQAFTGEEKGFNPADLGHIATEGYSPLRCLIAQMLKKGKDFEIEADNVLITAGSQQGLYLICKTLLEPGDYVVVESPTFIGAHQVFSAAGARILGLPVPGQFPFALLEDYLARYRPKLLYLIPTYHNPTGRVITQTERRELLRLAARYRLVVLEDDPYSELYYEDKPPASLKAMDRYGGVVYLGTFSKVLFPGLRIGYLVGHPALLNRIALEKQFIDLHSNNIAQWLLCRLLESGAFSEHLNLIRGEYRKRRDVLNKALRRDCGDSLSFALPGGGFYLWCKINRSSSAGHLLPAAGEEGITFVPGEAFYTQPSEGEKELRLCFVTHSEKKLRDAARKLARVLNATRTADKPGQRALHKQIKPIV